MDRILTRPRQYAATHDLFGDARARESGFAELDRELLLSELTFYGATVDESVVLAKARCENLKFPDDLQETNGIAVALSDDELALDDPAYVQL